MLLDADGYLADANEQARQLFGLAARDHGLLFQDLEISYRPTELRSPIAQAQVERRPIRLTGIEWTPAGTSAVRHLDIEMVPLHAGAEALGVVVFFHDRTRQRELEEKLRQSNTELEEAYQEVQSTNEELETTNEELQSTNDEFQSVNEELRVRSDEVDELNHFLEAILRSFRGGVVVVDRERRVRVWNSEAENLWGLREDEVRGADLLEVDIGLPVRDLEPALARAFGGSVGPDSQVVVEAITRRGRTVKCRVTFTPFLAAHDVVDGAIAVMEVLDE